MSIEKVWILLILSCLTSCTARKAVVIAPEYTFVTLDKATALQEEFSTNVGNKVYFSFDSYALSEEAKDKLKKQAKWLLTHPTIIVTIEGHCDERGSRDYNNILGLKRAEAVRKFLVAHGIDKNRLSTVSYGKDRPEVTNHNAEAWKLNRRTISVIIEAL